MPNSQQVSLSTQGQTQVLTIPHDFALAATEVVLRKEGDRLIIEPITDETKRSLETPLLTLLSTLDAITDNFCDPDENLLPLDDVAL